jgi:hypothetical protein
MSQRQTPPRKGDADTALEGVMAKFLLSYHGGSMGATPDEQAAEMAKWQAWFGGLGSALTDPGLPIMQARTVSSGGTADGGGSNMVTGYSIVEAADMEAAVAIARGCPLLGTGGTIEVGQTIPMA